MSKPIASESILARIRQSLGVGEEDAGRLNVVSQRLKTHTASLIPERARLPYDERVRLFAEMLNSQSATLTIVEDSSEIPEAISAYLRENNLPAHLRQGQDELLSNLPWERTPQLERLSGCASPDDLVALSRAPAAAAETGTLFLTSGPDNPTTLNFLPETHIVVLRSGDLFGAYEDAWNRLREVYGSGMMPRAVNLISGPSRTADIEQTIVMGAHGPKRLHVVLVAR
ncbi:MAG: lactate utilization protein [Alphaproteobacteria bacterium]